MGDLLGTREASEPMAELFGPRRRAAFERLLAQLTYDEATNEVVLALPGWGS